MPNDNQATAQAFSQLLDVLLILRKQCPWDAKQTNESLRPNTIEETMELCHALITNNVTDIKKELGDVLLHILFYSIIADEKGQFDFADVCNALREKLIFRHPHIFGETHVDNAEEVLQNWEAIKLKEKGGNKTVLSGVPTSLPSVIKAERIQEKTANVGFDWAKKEDVWAKVKEEIAEVEHEMAAGNQAGTEKEFGDLLFSVINAARLYGVRADNALELTNLKFINRFNYIEQQATMQGRKVNQLTLAEMDALWDEAKKQEKEA
ncbi:MAG: nucleoside triphosphate pyrophosphohydrolase [Muribaculaceae bacterium]